MLSIYENSRDAMCIFHLTEEGPEMDVEGARLPSILRLASCLSAGVTFSPFFGISGAYCDCSGEWPMDMPTLS